MWTQCALDADFNITDDTRIRAALPTLKKILADGGSVIIGSHLGRPKKVEDKYSLRHILAHVSECLGVDVKFAPDCVGEEARELAANLKPGEALLLENLRFYAEEEGKPRGLAEDASDEEKAAAKKAIKEARRNSPRSSLLLLTSMSTMPSVRLTALTLLRRSSLLTSMLTTSSSVTSWVRK